MKKYILYLLLIFTCQLFAQKYKITYSFSLNIDADTIKNQDKKYYYKNYFLSQYQNSYGVLWINKEGAFFEQEGNLKNLYYDNNYITTFYSSVKYKKIIKENSSTLFPDAPPYMYYSFSDFNWKITNQSKKINNYVCYKAIGNLKPLNPNLPNYYFEAWFSPEIPLQYGPNGYGGLPGLIFEIYFLDGTGVHWKLKSIDKGTFKSIIFPDFNNSENYTQSYKRTYDFFQKLKK